MQFKKRYWIYICFFGFLFISPFLIAFVIGSLFAAPSPAEVGPLPPDLKGQTVGIRSQSGSDLQSWFIPGKQGAVILMHGIKANRLSMLDRARFLHEAGFSVLLFDFQAHGESSGKQITTGYLESMDAVAAVDFIHRRLAGQKVAVIGVSMGGAAAILASPALQIDSLVAEQVYPDIDHAIGDRLEVWFAPWARVFTPLLTAQIQPRLGFPAKVLRPIDHVGDLHYPKLFIAGKDDQLTRIQESEEMFARAAEPKSFWAIDGADHVDFCAYTPSEYRQRVLEFLGQTLSTGNAVFRN